MRTLENNYNVLNFGRVSPSCWNKITFETCRD